MCLDTFLPLCTQAHILPYCHFTQHGFYLANFGHLQLTNSFAISEELDDGVNGVDHLI